MALRLDHFNWLDFGFVERSSPILGTRKIDGLHVDATDILVPSRSVVKFKRTEVSSGRELCGAWQILRNHPLPVLGADRDVEVVKNMKGLNHSFKRGWPFRCRGAEECGSDKTGRWCEISWKAEHCAVATKRRNSEGRIGRFGVADCEGLVRGGSRHEIDVVPQVGKMEFESRGVGERPDRVLVKDRLSVDIFKDHYAAAWLAETPVDGADFGVEAGDPDALDGFLDFIDGGTGGKGPADELHVAEAHRSLCGVIFRIFTKLGEEEKARGKTRFVDSFDDKFLIFSEYADVAEPCREGRSVLAFRRERDLGVVAWDNSVAAVHRVFEPLDRAGHDAAAILRFQSDAGACKGIAEAGRQHRRQHNSNSQ